jgi:DNA replication protein DnaC
MTPTFEKCPKCGGDIQCLSVFGEKVISCMCPCRREAWEKEKAEHEEYARQQRIRDFQKRVPEQFRGMTFEADDGCDKKTTDTLKKYVANFTEMRKTGQGLLFCGNVGTGKTFGAMCIANALAAQCIRVGCTTLTEVISNAQNWKHADDLFDDLLSNTLIVIDDLGTQRATDFANEKIYEFINECNTRNKCMIITTNLGARMFQEAVDRAETDEDLVYARIYSRILEKCFPIEVNTAKRRDKNRQARRAEMGKLFGGAQ